MLLRKALLESIRDKCSDALQVRVRRFLKPPVLETKVSPFSVVEMENGAIGISYNLFHRDAEVLERYRKWDMTDVVGKQAEELVSLFLSDDSLERTVGLAVLNALSQDFISKHPELYHVDATSNLFELMKVDTSSRVGMVGYFRPMMEKLLQQAGDVIVLEQSEVLLKESYPFTMTADPTKLRCCDKVLITATTVLNDSLPELMPHCSTASFVAIMGPTAGFLPDALFELGIHAVGYSRVEDPELFLHHFCNGIKWEGATRKVWVMQNNEKSR
jgi:uncharacterized protein (DUF4213/DUF364 family)